MQEVSAKKRKAEGENRSDEKSQPAGEATLTTAFKDAVKKANTQGAHIHCVQMFASIRSISLSVVLQTIASQQFCMHTETENRMLAQAKIEEKLSAKMALHPNLSCILKEIVKHIYLFTENHKNSSQCINIEDHFSVAYPIIQIKPLCIPLFHLPQTLSQETIIEFSMKETEFSLFETTQRMVGMSQLNPYFNAASKADALQMIMRCLDHYTKSEDGQRQCIEWNILMKHQRIGELEFQKRIITKKNPNIASRVTEIETNMKEVAELEENIMQEEQKREAYISNMEKTLRNIARYSGNGEEMKQKCTEGMNEIINFLKAESEKKKQLLKELAASNGKMTDLIDKLKCINELIKNIKEEITEIEGLKEGLWYIWYDEEKINAKLSMHLASCEEAVNALFEKCDQQERGVPIRFIKEILAEKAVFFDGIHSINRALDM